MAERNPAPLTSPLTSPLMGTDLTDLERGVSRLLSLWERERQAEEARFVAEREAIPLKERLTRGLALTELEIEETRPASGDRVVICVRTRRQDLPFDRQRVRLRPGDPVVLFRRDPAEPAAVRGIAARWQGSLLGLSVDAGGLDHLEAGPFRLEREAPSTTFDRGRDALQRLLSVSGEDARILNLARGRIGLHTNPLTIQRWHDEALDEAQRAAVAHALRTEPVALIHGPPGTGKTRCLVEVIRQALDRGLRVLVVAPSNTAVDNLTERLLGAGIPALRVGHPARVSAEVEAATLDARLDATEASRLARGWMKEAQALRLRTERQAERGSGDREGRREAFREARRMMADARHHLRRAEGVIVDDARVVCATLALAAHPALREQRFDLAVVDEATQAVEPLVWIPLTRAPRAILAGDPRQLPPTVIDPEAARAGLGKSLFERLHAELGDDLLRMLVTQHRMHEHLMAFPSASMYDGRLIAHETVATHSLETLDGVGEDPLRGGPLIFIDAAGAGWAELRREPDGSTFNPELAERTALEVSRLIARGVPLTAIGVIAPYDAQVALLRAALVEQVADGLEVRSIDGFQGREKEVIVLDLVRSNDAGEIGFLADTRRMNVALTRARRQLVVLGDSATIGAHPFYGSFLEHAEILGQWLSVFADDGLG